MQATDGVVDVARAIQLALAPVFLLTGIAGMLNVMAGRLTRIIDRGRALTEGGLASVATPGELRTLELRRHVVSVAITACTIAALLVCLVIPTLFAEVMLGAPLEWLIGILFTTSTLSLVVGLAYFLREVYLATSTIRIRISGPGTPA
jgi:hypothetical protein